MRASTMDDNNADDNLFFAKRSRYLMTAALASYKGSCTKFSVAALFVG